MFDSLTINNIISINNVHPKHSRETAGSAINWCLWCESFFKHFLPINSFEPNIPCIAQVVSGNSEDARKPFGRHLFHHTFSNFSHLYSLYMHDYLVTLKSIGPWTTGKRASNFSTKASWGKHKNWNLGIWRSPSLVDNQKSEMNPMTDPWDWYICLHLVHFYGTCRYTIHGSYGNRHDSFDRRNKIILWIHPTCSDCRCARKVDHSWPPKVPKGYRFHREN